MKQEETVIAKWAPALLAMELQRWFWKDKPYIKVKDLWDSLCTYCYLPRLSSYQVLEDAIQVGLATDDYFGIAEGAFEDGSYLGLKFNTSSHMVDRSNYILTVDAVKKAIQAKEKEVTDLGSSEVADIGELFPLPPQSPVIQPKQPIGPRHFYLSTKLDTTRYIRDIGKLNEEVLNHLLGQDGSNVEIRLDVQISFKEDVPNDTVRTVIENCRTLKVEDSGFD
jgi:hypothetical protein